ncbi:unnamed protein product [Caenorhabditis angaria]|uniref:CCR4-NOT transcription complex subunit 1 n=1 Tax=Caenorhabditis angaria TaxID=860376 RepID=A0A9P1IGG2_9PELO|nr:unnamed protein product [Caenorhabditis angaria]
MPIGHVMNRCSCAYIDHLLQHKSIHRGKSQIYMFQRLIVVCSRSSLAVTRHAARVLLSPFGFVEIYSSVKKFVEESDAIGLIAQITSYSCEETGFRSSTEIKGAQNLFTAICDEIIEYLLEVDESNSIPVIRDFVKKIISHFPPTQSLAILNKITTNTRVRKLLKPVFLKFIENYEYPDLYASISRRNLDPVCLIEIVANFVAKEYQLVLSENCDSLKFVHNLVQIVENQKLVNETNGLVVQALAFLIYSTSRKRNFYGMSEEHVKNQLESTETTSDLVLVNTAIQDSDKEAIVRKLEIHGTGLTDDVEVFIRDALITNLNTITTKSVGAAFFYMCVTILEIVSSGEEQIEDPDSALFWNGQIFARAINQFSESNENCQIDWIEVLKELDCEEYLFHWRILKYIDEVCREAFKPPKVFPIHFFLGQWKFFEAHLAFIGCLIRHPSSFDLSIYEHTKVIRPEDLELENVLSNEKVDDNILKLWNILDITNIILTCTSKEPNILIEIRRMFDIGFTYCPDIVVLALIRSTSPWAQIRLDILRSYIPIVILSSENIASILNIAWGDPDILKHIRNIIVQSIAGLYVQDDEERLEKLLKITHELKPNGISEVLSLSAKNLTFMIDFACLASKREYLKLEKWLEEKEKTQGAAVTNAVLLYIERRYKEPEMLEAWNNEEETSEPLRILLIFANKKATAKQKQLFASIFQVMKENSGRSSSVSSAGGRNSVQIGPAVFGSGPPPVPITMPPPQQPPTDQRPPPVGVIQQPPPPIGRQVSGFGAVGLPGFSAAVGQPHLMTQPPQMMSLGPFGKGAMKVQPAPPQPSSMSPSNQMIRSQIPPLTQRQNSQSGGWHGLPQPTSRAPGPATPQHIDFRQGLQTDLSSQRLGSTLSLTSSQNLDDSANVSFDEDIQEEANSYFEKIYSTSNAMSVNELIALLKTFKTSSVIREQQVLACVVKNLFEEYRFFHEYPERELRTTAAVYGGIIREGIISNVQFATAVRKVIEALSAEVNSMLWTFGIVALQYCRNKLCTYPKVCNMIATCENFSKFPQNLKDYVLAGIKGEMPADAGRSTPTNPVNWGAITRASSVDPKTSLPANRTGNSVLSYTNTDTLVTATEKDGAEIAQPCEAIVDKISFLFNNLSHNNLTEKKNEVIQMMEEHGEGFTRWLSQYIVMKRVSIEQNFQPLYNQFVQAIDNSFLDSCIKRETFRNIKILLRTDKRTNVASNYSDRQLLKNLGMWLGSITIARNRPILLNDLDLKSLLLEAYYKGQAELLFVVPFISKILMSCSKTTLFTSKCAWIRSILKVLAELHNEPDLKINLKFEIEVLCKELNVDLNQLPIDGILKDTEKLVRVPQQLCEIKILQRPEGVSPVPSQLRLTGSADALGGASPSIETKPSTPQPEGNDLLGPGGIGGGQGGDAQITPNVTHFSYHDINVLTYEGLTPHLIINSSLQLFQLHPHAKHMVKLAMTNAIKELIGPVTERALKIAMTVTESMIKKDFAMDPDEKNLKLAAFHMMRAMTAGMAMITCRDPLASTMVASLTQSFITSLKPTGSNPELKQLIDEAAQAITQQNIELSTNFIVKTACEKASTEIEKRLEPEYAKRKAAKQNEENYRDEVMMAIQNKLPAKIAIAPGSVEKSNLAVYEQFSSRICGFKPTNDDSTSIVVADLVQQVGGLNSANANAPMKEIDAIVAQMQHFVKEVDQTTQAQPHVGHNAFQSVLNIRELLQHVIVARSAQSLVNLINKSVENLLVAYHFESATKNLLDVEWTRRLRDLFVGVMRLMQSHFNISDLSRRVTTAVISIRAEHKWNMEGIEILLKQNLIQTALWDQHLAASMESSGSLEPTMFAQKFVRGLGISDANKLNFLKEKFPLTCEQLSKLHALQNATRAQNDISNGAAAAAAAAATAHNLNIGSHVHEQGENLQQQRNFDDPDMTQKVELILREWIQLCYTPTGQRNPQEALSQMIQLMHEQGVLATDDKITQFFRLCVEMCVDVSVRMLKNDQVHSGLTQSFLRHRCYYTLDAFVKLMALMIRHSDNGQSQNKINLLKKLLNIVVGVLHMDHEVRRNDFNAMPYHRILISLFNEITGPDPQRLLDPIAWSILEAFGQTFFALQPRRMPGFAFAWLDIVGHRNVIGRLLANTGIAETVDAEKTAATYTQLIISHLKFLAPFLRNIQLPKSIAILYKGTLRVLLVILHDFPELLCEFHYAICDTIPPNCVQLRNLVLSAYPRNMRLPDPFALNFKQVDSIPEMIIEPKSNINMATMIPVSIREPLDDYLANRSSVEFLSSLPSLLQYQTPNVTGSRYNTTVMNALVLYVGIRAIESLRTRKQRISIHTIAHTSYMDVFQNLAVQLCTEGRYLLFNGIANQLRYPNAHTHYFSCVFLFLFRNSDCDAIQEQITRILFERLVALRPHPWGLLITFIELIKNPTYMFWKYDFTRCAPEIERLFQNVANTCVPSQSPAAVAAAAAAGIPVPTQSQSQQQQQPSSQATPQTTSTTSSISAS